MSLGVCGRSGFAYTRYWRSPGLHRLDTWMLGRSHRTGGKTDIRRPSWSIQRVRLYYGTGSHRTGGEKRIGWPSWPIHCVQLYYGTQERRLILRLRLYYGTQQATGRAGVRTSGGRRGLYRVFGKRQNARGSEDQVAVAAYTPCSAVARHSRHHRTGGATDIRWPS